MPRGQQAPGLVVGTRQAAQAVCPGLRAGGQASGLCGLTRGSPRSWAPEGKSLVGTDAAPTA